MGADSNNGRARVHAELRPTRLPHPRRVPGERRVRGVPQGGRDGAGGGPWRGEEVEPARPGRCRLPHRHQVGLRAEAANGAGLPGGQRRRGRAGHVQGPLSPRARPPRPHRGDAHRLLRDRLPDVLHLHPRRVRPAVADLLGGGGGGGGGRPARPEHHGDRLRPSDRRPPGRRRLHLRGGDRAAVVAGGEEGLAEDQAAVPRGEGRLRASDGRQQRGDDLRPAAHRQPGWGVVRRPRDPHPGRHADVLGLRPRQSPRGLRAAGHGDDARADLRPGGRHPRRPRAEGRGPRRLVRRCSSRLPRST